MKFSVSLLKILTVIFLLNSLAFSFERVVVLAPACVDIFEKLDAKDKVVGVTRHVKNFPKAKKVGSHIKPNIELIVSLKPDLVIYSNNKFFPEQLREKLDAKFFRYDPRTLDEIFFNILEIGKLIGKEDKAKFIVKSMKEKIKRVKKLDRAPRVIYEVMYVPYMVAGDKNIVSDIIRLAGGINLIKQRRKLVRFSLEKAVSLKPDIYIYQVGPMNKKAPPPEKRLEFKSVKAKFLKVDELMFSRANTNSADAVLLLNDYFYKWSNK